MSDIVNFTCPKCGHNVMKTTAEPNKKTMLKNAICAKCGASVSDKDVERQAGKIADDIVRKMLDGLK